MARHAHTHIHKRESTKTIIGDGTKKKRVLKNKPKKRKDKTHTEELPSGTLTETVLVLSFFPSFEPRPTPSALLSVALPPRRGICTVRSVGNDHDRTAETTMQSTSRGASRLPHRRARTCV